MKIRIAVAVDSEGHWAPSLVPSYAENELRNNWRGVTRRHIVFVEADVPLPPEPQVIQGTVQETKE